jgi:hypothetical protein
MAKLSIVLAGFAIVASTTALAAPSIDPAGDFISSYTGPQNADLDVLSSQVLLHGSVFNFTATLGGAIGTTTGGFYVFGVDRGAGTARFGALASNVLFDSVVVINNNGTGFTRDLLAGVTTALAPGSINFSGASLSAFVDTSLLPSAGFAPSSYSYNLWPRSPGAGNSTIADFAPDNANASIAAVPEPASWALLIAGFGLVGATARRRRMLAA